MFSKNIVTLLALLTKDGQLDLNLEDEVIRETLVTHDGQVTHPRIRDLLGLPAEFVLPVVPLDEEPEPDPEQPDPDSYELEDTDKH